MRSANLAKSFIVFLATIIALPAAAGPYADALSTCLADNTTGKERKELARWAFAAMAAHPDMRNISNVTEQVRDQTSHIVGVLFTRLISENCSEQTRAAVQKDGSQSLQMAFGSLGKLAMQELMANPDVSASMGAFAKYIDRQKIDSIVTPK